MDDYIQQRFVVAQEYLESGIHFSNKDFLYQAESILLQLIKLIDEGKGKQVLIDKILRLYTALSALDPQNRLVLLEKALKYDENNEVVYNNLGYHYHKIEMDYNQSLFHYNKCLEIDKELEIGYLGIIDLFRSFRQHTLELKYCKQGIKYCPNSSGIFNVYGLAMLNNNKFKDMDKIINIFKKGLVLCGTDGTDNKKNKCKILVNLGHVSGIIGKYKDGLDYYLQALEADPLHANAYQNILLNIHYIDSTEYLGSLLQRFNVKGKGNVPRMILKLHHVISSILYPKLETTVIEINKINNNSKINIGYVSSDLFEHAVGYFSRVLFTNYNSQQFNVHVYSNNVYNTETVNTLPCTSYKCIKDVSRDLVADWIKKDSIDILVDLSGHTAGNRLDVFNLKPAPILLTYLGYPNETGMSFGRISDQFTELHKPKKSLVYTMERLFLCYTPPKDYTYNPIDRNVDYITFGCFAKLQKINDTCVNVWKEILTLVPNSKLVLKSKYFKDPKVCLEWKAKFEPFQDKLLLLKGTKDFNQHLNMYNYLDIHLDTWPYSGTTISTESLFMNVPVVCLEGVGHVERVTASILHSMDLDTELIAQTKQEYIQKAVRVAFDKPFRENLCIRERFMKTDITNKESFMKEYEKLLKSIHQERL